MDYFYDHYKIILGLFFSFLELDRPREYKWKKSSHFLQKFSFCVPGKTVIVVLNDVMDE